MRIEVEENDIVKIRRDSDRLWVVIAYRDDENIYAMVDNLINKNYCHGDVIIITVDEIIDIWMHER